MILTFLKAYWKEIAIALVIAFLAYRIYDAGYASGIKKYDAYIADQTIASNRAKVVEAEAKTDVLIKYKDKIVYVEKKSGKVSSEIKNGVLNEESSKCIVGPKFIGMHNLSAQD